MKADRSIHKKKCRPSYGLVEVVRSATVIADKSQGRTSMLETLKLFSNTNLARTNYTSNQIVTESISLEAKPMPESLRLMAGLEGASIRDKLAAKGATQMSWGFSCYNIYCDTYRF